jgi:hypothetical protein
MREIAALKLVLPAIPLLLLPATLLGQAAVSVASIPGCNRNGANAASTTAAFNQAFSRVLFNGQIVIPRGDYAINNPLTISNFSGQITFETGARLLFQNNGSVGLHFSGGAGAKITGLHATYRFPATRRGTAAEILFSGTTDTRVANAVIEAATAIAIQFIDSIRPQLQNIVVVNSLADGVHFANCQNAEITSLRTENTGDDGLAFLNVASDSHNYTGGFAKDITIHNSRARGIAVAGQSDVSISGFRVDNTSSSGIICLQDTAYNTRVPDRVRFSGGVIRNAGTLTPLHGNQYGIEFARVNGATFENIEVFGAPIYPSGAMARGVSGNAPYNATSSPIARVRLSHIRVFGAGETVSYDGFNLDANHIELEDCLAQSTPGYGFYITGAARVLASGLTAINTSIRNNLHRAIWFENNNGNETTGSGRVMASDLKVIDTQRAPTGYVVGGYTSRPGNSGQVGIINGVAGRFSNGASITISTYPQLVVLNSHSI